MTRTPVSRKIDLDDTITGAAFRDFYQNHWPSEWYVEETYIDFEDEVGKYILPDDAKVKLRDLGYAGWQGPGTPPDGHRSCLVAELYIKAMTEITDEVYISFRVPADKADELASAAAALGATEI